MFENAAQNEQFLKLTEKRAALEKEISDPAVSKSSREYAQTVKKFHEIGKLLSVWESICKIDEDALGARELLSDKSPEMRELAQEDLERLALERKALEEELKILLLPKDPNDDKNTIVEIRAGTGGDEAALFGGDLLRMYMHYAERKNWKVEIMSLSPSGDTGYKEAVFMVKGNKVYSHLKHESGVHRVQRVPDTESQGRIHTSAATVAVLPEADELDIAIKPEEIRVDIFRSSGPGGQSVNTTDSAVRITHLPTGLVVSCQDEKSQLRNKLKAMTVLRARLLDLRNAEQQKKISSERKEQVGSGDRSERIRTYNYPQGRVTDHRINLTLYRLPSIMNGDLDEIVSTLGSHFQAVQLSKSQEIS
jgi:peptide chain release factor 1